MGAGIFSDCTDTGGILDWPQVQISFDMVAVGGVSTRLSLCGYEEESWPCELMANQGFRAPSDDIVGAYNFTDLDRGHIRRN